MKKRIIIFSVMLFILVGCSKKVENIIPTEISAVHIYDKSKEVKIYLDEDGWKIDSLYTNNEELQYFLYMINNINPKLIEENTEDLEYIYSLEFNAKGNDEVYELYRDKNLNDNNLIILFKDQFYTVNNPYLADFSLGQLYNRFIFYEEDAELESIQFTDDKLNQLILNKENKLSSIESPMALSGWFLNDYYNRSYSVKSPIMDLIYESTYALRGDKLDELNDFKVEYSFISSYNDDSKREFEVMISPENINEVIVKHDGEFYLSPRRPLKFLMVDKSSVVDAFGFIAKLDDLDSITVSQGNKEMHIEGQLKINDKKENETLVRDIYQHLLLIYGKHEYNNQEIGQKLLTITYKYPEGSSEINLYEGENDRIAIERDGSIDWMMNREEYTLLISKIKRFVR